MDIARVRIFLVVSICYIIIAGFAFLIWYIIRKKKIAFNTIQLYFFTAKDFQREIAYSLSTMFIFTFIIWSILGNDAVRSYTTWYSDINQHGRVYYWLAFPIMLLMYNTYFYFTHRLMHYPKFFKFLHVGHHKSINPSPWAAFAFYPSEAVVEIGILVVFLFTIPILKAHLFFFFLFMMV